MTVARPPCVPARVTAVDTRCDIGSLSREEIADAFALLGLPKFRVGQVVRWLYGRGATGFAEMTDLPASLRDELSRRYVIGGAEVVARQISEDGTRKYLVRFDDGTSVETVGLPVGDRLTVCFST